MDHGFFAQDAVIAGTYRIVRLLGRGGMGEVFEAVHLRTGASLAIKVLLADFSHRSDVMARFQREAEVTSRLRHPNIVAVVDFDRLPDGRPFLVMELLGGAALGTVLRAGRPVDLPRVANIVDQVALALAATHDAGVVHRDLSPGNIFIERLPGTDRELVRVLDFGISKIRDGHSDLTNTKVIMGTPHYMSPEQALGRTKQTDARADQFALAAIAYELLTGRRAFAADDPQDGDATPAVLYRVVHADPPTFAALGLALPPRVEQVVLKALTKDPSQRFGDIIAFSNALKAAIADAPVGVWNGDLTVHATGPRRAGSAEAISPGGTLRLPDASTDSASPLVTTLGDSVGEVPSASAGRPRKDNRRFTTRDRAIGGGALVVLAAVATALIVGGAGARRPSAPAADVDGVERPRISAPKAAAVRPPAPPPANDQPLPALTAAPEPSPASDQAVERIFIKTADDTPNQTPDAAVQPTERAHVDHPQRPPRGPKAAPVRRRSGPHNEDI